MSASPHILNYTRGVSVRATHLGWWWRALIVVGLVTLALVRFGALVGGYTLMVLGEAVALILKWIGRGVLWLARYRKPRASNMPLEQNPLPVLPL